MTRARDAAAIVLELAILAPLVAPFGWFTLSGKPVLVISGEGIIVCRRRRRSRGP